MSISKIIRVVVKLIIFTPTILMIAGVAILATGSTMVAAIVLAISAWGWFFLFSFILTRKEVMDAIDAMYVEATGRSPQ